MPNLFSSLPVVVYSWVWGSTSGLTRRQARAVTPSSTASAAIASSSLSDSTLNRPTGPRSAGSAAPKLAAEPRNGLKRPSSAERISSSVLPTPAKTISDIGVPESQARSSSPPETTSMPAPSSRSSRQRCRLGLALTA